MKKITYRELLNMIKEGTNPEVVYFRRDVFKWDRNSYFSNNSEYLSEILSKEATDSGLTNTLYISYDDKILDEKEKEYLSNIIKPFKKYVCSINKIKEHKQERICIFYEDYLERAKGEKWCRSISLPTFKAGTMYKGMELWKNYKLEELGL